MPRISRSTRRERSELFFSPRRSRPAPFACAIVPLASVCPCPCVRAYARATRLCAIALFSSFRRRFLPPSADRRALFGFALVQGDGETSLIDFFCLSCLFRSARLFRELLFVIDRSIIVRSSNISFYYSGAMEDGTEFSSSKQFCFALGERKR